MRRRRRESSPRPFRPIASRPTAGAQNGEAHQRARRGALVRGSCAARARPSAHRPRIRGDRSRRRAPVSHDAVNVTTPAHLGAVTSARSASIESASCPIQERSDPPETGGSNRPRRRRPSWVSRPCALLFRLHEQAAAVATSSSWLALESAISWPARIGRSSARAASGATASRRAAKRSRGRAWRPEELRDGPAGEINALASRMRSRSTCVARSTSSARLVADGGNAELIA